MEKQKAVLEMLAQILHIRHLLLQQGLADCLGTLVLVTFGFGFVAQMLCSGGSHGAFLTSTWPLGSPPSVTGVRDLLPVSMGSHTQPIITWKWARRCVRSLRIRGGHLNPAVTFALCLLGREPWRKFLVYFLFQMFGAFLGAKIIFGIYSDALWDYGQETLSVDGTNATIFATYPSPHLSLLNGFFDQEIGMATLIVCILAIVEPQNTPVNPGSREGPFL
ncbi:unnamed protein product [Arctogadus glacialis]